MMPKPATPLRVVAEFVGVFIGLWLAMPLNCAFYPQFRNIEVSKLEPEIQEAAKAKGILSLSYNKGL